MRLKEGICFECGELSELHNHHVVPRSRGGTKTVPLCNKCHSKAHHRNKNMNTSKLTREALARLKAQGVKLGNPNIATARVAALRVRQANAATYREDMLPVIAEIQSSGISTLQGIADSLNRRGYSARRGGCFYPGTVRSILKTQRVQQKENK